jgi:hypothetical protein
MAVVYSRSPERQAVRPQATSAGTRQIVQRLFILIALLSSPTLRPLSEMATFLGVTPRTLKRDFRFLRSLGLHIEYHKADNGYTLDLRSSRASELGTSLINMARWIVLREGPEDSIGLSLPPLASTNGRDDELV